MNKIPQEEYDKIWGQFKLQLNGVFDPFNCHGLDIYIPGAIEATVALAELACERVRGKDIPITINYANTRVKKKRANK